MAQQILTKPLPATRQRILIIDDTTSIIQVLHSLLSHDYDVFFATNGARGIDIARSERPDLILLDVMMPDMDGYQVCEMLKSDPQTRHIPLIFITAKTDTEDEARGLAMGAIDYLTKPISPPIVTMRVRNHLELKRYRDYLEHLSSVDALTGIANRRHFDEQLEKEWRRAVRQHGDLSLALIDVDYFKTYNDRYGHGAGDECLRRVSASFVEGLQRATDLIARIGGEEFACLLPDTDQAGALTVAERLRLDIASLSMPHEGNQDTGGIVSVSVGAASTQPNLDLSPEALVAEADRCLYKAKNTGRNRSVVETI